jgi:hypothetical protein
VHPFQARPPEGEETATKNERDKGAVKNNDSIG